MGTEANIFESTAAFMTILGMAVFLWGCNRGAGWLAVAGAMIVGSGLGSGFIYWGVLHQVDFVMAGIAIVIAGALLYIGVKDKSSPIVYAACVVVGVAVGIWGQALSPEAFALIAGTA